MWKRPPLYQKKGNILIFLFPAGYAGCNKWLCEWERPHLGFLTPFKMRLYFYRVKTTGIDTETELNSAETEKQEH